jgi:hypothetical protein
MHAATDKTHPPTVTNQLSDFRHSKSKPCACREGHPGSALLHVEHGRTT